MFTNAANSVAGAAQAAGSMGINALKDNIMSIASTESPGFTVPSNGGDDNNNLLNQLQEKNDMLQAENESLHGQVTGLAAGLGSTTVLFGVGCLLALYGMRLMYNGKKAALESLPQHDPAAKGRGSQPTKSGWCPTLTKALASFCCSFPCCPRNSDEDGYEFQDPRTPKYCPAAARRTRTQSHLPTLSSSCENKAPPSDSGEDSTVTEV